MSDLASAMTETHLTAYRGREVRRVRVKLTGAGDGLSEALSIDPLELDMGQIGYALVKFVAGPHKHRVMKGYEHGETDAPLELEMELVAQTVTIVDEDYAGKPIDAQRERIRLAKDAAKGVASLPGTVGTGKPGDGWAAEDDEVSNVHQFPGNGSTASPADTCVCADVRDEHEGNGSGPCEVEGCDCNYFEAVDPNDDEIPDDDTDTDPDNAEPEVPDEGDTEPAPAEPEPTPEPEPEPASTAEALPHERKPRAAKAAAKTSKAAAKRT